MTTTYTNNAAGDVAAVSYSDGTPGMANVYDQAGRLWSNFCNGITTTRSYDLANDLLVESYSGGALGGFSVTNGFDNLLRRTTVAVLSNSTPILHSSMSYDAASRLSTVSDGTNSATYFYVANSSLVDHIVFARGNTNVMTNQNTYDNLNRLTGTSSALSYNYQYNLAGQRTKVTQLIDGSYWLYVYDALGQLISAKKFFWDGTPYAGQQFGFGFDTIGNRTSTLAGGDSTGANLRQANYANNALNQITSRDVPGYVDIMGLALATNTVSVNGSSAYRKWEYFREQVGVNNTNNAVWENVTVTTQTATNSGSLFVARTPENFGYDADGNQLSDGRFNYTWDAENRLISAASLAGAPTASLSSNVFAYDYMGRRIQKVVSTWNTASNAYVVSYTNKFLYDGWNVVAILDGSNNVLYTCTWGTDLSGSMQGAGGVGGLLAITYCAPNAGTNAGTYFCCYDGNGNIVALVNAANGTVAANYEYGPFGELIRATGPMAKLNPFMFSTKFYDWETGLYYYGYRYYNPSIGRWLSRDPEEEDGGLNLYCFVANNGVNQVDLLGDDTIDSLITANIGYDHSWPVLGPFGIPIPAIGARFQIQVYISGHLFNACDHGSSRTFAAGTIGAEAYLTWGKSGLRTPTVPGRDRNKPAPGGGKQKQGSNQPIPPDSGYRSRTWHVDVNSPMQQAPQDGLHVTGSGYIFLRGSAGFGAGVQFNITKTFQADTDFTDGWSFGGSVAGNIWGASVDVGGGGTFDFTYGPINGISQ